MKKSLGILGAVLGLVLLAVIVDMLLTPWMDRWGATAEEIAAALPGDGLVPDPSGFVNRAVTIHARPEQIYPWIVQLGAGRGGYYSYTWLETYLLQCKMVNADRIHPEWQELKVGDTVRMCPGDFGPPPYQVALIEPGRAVAMGHQENGKWMEAWQFTILPQADGSSRLVLRTRTKMSGAFWAVIHPGIFVMERGMLLGIKARAEALADP